MFRYLLKVKRLAFSRYLTLASLSTSKLSRSSLAAQLLCESLKSGIHIVIFTRVGFNDSSLGRCSTEDDIYPVHKIYISVHQGP